MSFGKLWRLNQHLKTVKINEKSQLLYRFLYFRQFIPTYEVTCRKYYEVLQRTQSCKRNSLEVNRGEIVGLLGPNGAGKTTSFYMIVGLIKPNGGTIFLDQQEITDYPMYKRAQNGIGYLAQEASVFRKLSIEDNILSVLQLTKLSKKSNI